VVTGIAFLGLFPQLDGGSGFWRRSTISALPCRSRPTTTIGDFDDPTVAAMASLVITLTVARVFTGLDRFLDLKGASAGAEPWRRADSARMGRRAGAVFGL
jgi:hypothetical protein